MIENQTKKFFVCWFCQDIMNVLLLKEGIGGSYRLASLDRLASRQRLLEQNGGLGNVVLEKNGNHNNHHHHDGMPITIQSVRCFVFLIIFFFHLLYIFFNVINKCSVRNFLWVHLHIQIFYIYLTSSHLFREVLI